MTREEATIQALINHIEALEETIKALEQEPCEDCISREVVLIDVNNITPKITVRHGKTSTDSCLMIPLERVVDVINKSTPVTPQPKSDVLDKIRAEIQNLRNCSCSCSDGIIDDVEDIIDKYKAESEVIV